MSPSQSQEGRVGAGHTPGPWTVEPGDRTVYSGDTLVATVDARTTGYDGKKRAEIAANVALIKSAPDMLALLERSLAHLSFVRDGNASTDDLIADLCAAIRRATGEG